jgi:hypothetical protein
MDNSLNAFQCQNCGRKSTATEVISTNANCPKCRDTIIAYTIDCARAIVELENRAPSAVEEELRECLDIAVKALRIYCQTPMCSCTAQTAQQEISALLAKKGTI